jgi:transcriptional regulator with XRE-family HTH domain
VTTDNTKRAKALTDRIAALGLSGRELAAQSGVARGTVSNALGGTAGRGTYERLEKFLGDLEHEMESDALPSDTPKAPTQSNNDLVEFRLTGNFGVDVVVRGPVSDLAELEAAVTRLMSRMGNVPPEG